MRDKPWRSPLIDFSDPLTNEDLLDDLRGDGENDAEITAEAIRLFMTKYAVSARGMTHEELVHEALWARWVRPPAHRGPKRSSYRLMTAERYERRIALHMGRGLTARKARRAALDDEKAGRWLADDWSAQRSLLLQRQEIARELQSRGEQIPPSLAAALDYGDLPEAPPDPNQRPELCAEPIADYEGSGDEAVRQRIRESRMFWKRRRQETLRKSLPK